MSKTVVVLSGGLDSTTLLYHLMDEGHEVKGISINYNQRHSKELQYAINICNDLKIEHRLVEIPGISAVFGSNALTSDSAEVPEGEYKDGTIQVTTVPNRNMIFLSIAIGWAISLDFENVAFGAHAGIHTNYPDCKPPFANAMNEVSKVCDWKPIKVLSPFIEWNKGDIVKRGNELNVPFEKTWSCYQGGQLHCGKCSTCNDRLWAFKQLKLKDMVKYESENVQQ